MLSSTETMQFDGQQRGLRPPLSGSARPPSLANAQQRPSAPTTTAKNNRLERASTAVGSRRRSNSTTHTIGGDGGGGSRAGKRASRCASAPVMVASEVVVNEKTFATATPPQAMAVSRHLVWISFADGGCEVRNGRTAEVVKRFAGCDPASTAAASGGGFGSFPGAGLLATGKKDAEAKGGNVVIRAILSVLTRCGEPQVWLGLSNGTIEVHHGETAELICVLQKHLGGVNALAEFGGLVYSGGKDQQVVQWRSEGCRFIRAFMGAMGHEGSIECMHAEGNALVTGAADDTVKVWDVGTGDMQLTGYFHARSGGVSALCRVGQVMWSGDNSGQLVRWTLRACEAVDISVPHQGRITTLKRAGSRVYSGSADGSIGVFSAETGLLLKRIEDQAKGWLTCIVCLAELSRFVMWSADSSGRVQCWYQDEYVFMSRDHEQLNDAAWYRSGSTPYGEFRLSVAQRNAQLQDQLSTAEKRDAQAVATLRKCSTLLGGGAAADVERQYARLQDHMRMIEDRRAKLSQDLQKKKEDAAHAERELATTLALIQSTSNDLNVLDPGYGDRLMATLPPMVSSSSPIAAPTATGFGATTAIGAAPGVTITGMPGAFDAAPPGVTGMAPVVPGVAFSLPTNPMLPPLPLSLPGGVPSTGGVLPLPVAPLQPLGSTAPGGGAGAGAGALTGTAATTAAGITPGVVGTATATGLYTALPLPLAPASLGGPLAAATTAGGGSLGVPASMVPGVVVGSDGVRVAATTTAAAPGSSITGGQPGQLSAGASVAPVNPIGVGGQLSVPVTGGTAIGVSAGVLPGVAAGTATGMGSGVLAGAATGAPMGTAAAGALTGTAAGVGAGVLSGAATGVSTGALPGMAAGTATGMGSGVLAGAPMGTAAAGALTGTAAGVGAAAGVGVGAGAAPAAFMSPEQRRQEQLLSHERQVLALLALLDNRDSSDNRDDKSKAEGGGVKWVNPNVGNYIQRRYYGAFPSLTAPAIERRSKRRAHTPKVKVVPLSRSSFAAAKQKETEEKR